MAALIHIYTTTNADITVMATKTANSTLTKEAQVVTDGRPIYDFKVTDGGKFDPTGTATRVEGSAILSE